MTASKRILIPLLLALFLQGCFRAQRLNVEPQAVQATATVVQPTSTVTFTPLPSPTTVDTATDILPTSLPPVTVTAVGGNLYIRRGPGMDYDRIALLKKGSSAEVIGQDVLSKWVQIYIPGSDGTGWVSIMSDLTQVEGDLERVPDFTFTDWAQPVFIKNCTEHNFYIEPGGISLFSLYTNSKYLNEVQVDPGVYTFYDLFVPGEPETETVDIREGQTYYITVDGLDVKHNCP